ncbi:MAG: NAD(P)H-binding protein [Candidatus Neomarinimicrobiota bacterium]
MAVEPRSALLLGATGLVGGHCLRLLLDHSAFSRVMVLARGMATREHPQLEWQVADFEALEDHARLFAVDAVFCCLGTTRAKAGSANAFRRVDHDYPLAAASLAARQGARQFLLVSSMGANPESRFLYPRVKGDLEEALRNLSLVGVHIFRPSFLQGRRRERRIMERIGSGFLSAGAPLLVGPLRRWRPIHAATVARAMVRTAVGGVLGYHVYPSDELAWMGRAEP